MSGAHDCQRSRLAVSPVGFVELCSCGSIHVGVGPLTLRIDPATFDRFAAMVAEARDRLGSPTLTPSVAARFARVPHEAN